MTFDIRKEGLLVAQWSGKELQTQDRVLKFWVKRGVPVRKTSTRGSFKGTTIERVPLSDAGFLRAFAFALADHGYDIDFDIFDQLTS